MSKLDDLIKELCPEGVEYKRLGEIATYAKDRIDANTVNKETFVSVENLLPNKQGKIASSCVPTEGKLIRFKKNDVLIGNIRPYLKKIWLAEYDGGTNGDVLTIHIVCDKVAPEFLYYCLSSDQFFQYDTQYAKGAKMPRGDKNVVMDYTIPVPPLPVQAEIVRILDNFTALTAELTKKLTAELTKRRQQYEHYRDVLLDLKNYPYLKLEQLCHIVDYRGKTPRKVDRGIFLITAKNIRKGFIDYEKSREFISEEDYDDIMRRGKPEIGDVLITTEAPCGNVAQVDRKNVALAQRVIKYRPKTDALDATFLRFILLGEEFQNKLVKAATGGTVKGIKGSRLHQLTIPVPPVERQRKIVAILDRFDALCNDLTSGLPAEIEARKKQYEHYRDKLLSFEPRR